MEHRLSDCSSLIFDVFHLPVVSVRRALTFNIRSGIHRYFEYALYCLSDGGLLSQKLVCVRRSTKARLVEYTPLAAPHLKASAMVDPANPPTAACGVNAYTRCFPAKEGSDQHS